MDTTQRLDSRRIQAIQKTFGRATARKWAELPAMQLKTEDFNPTYDVDNIHNLEHGLEDLLPFEEMVFYFTDYDSPRKIVWHAKIKLIPPEEDGQRLHVEVDIPIGKECYMATYTTMFIPGGVTLYDKKIRTSKRTNPPIDMKEAMSFFRPYSVETTPSGKEENLFQGTIEDGVPMPIIPVAALINALVQFEEQDKRPIIQKRKTSFKDKKAARTNPAARKDLQSIIYLDNIPEEHQKSTGTGQTRGPLKMGHRRRGHWRQLTHPRYKTPRKVRVRPSWVGPDQWSHNGSLYKLVHTV